MAVCKPFRNQVCAYPMVVLGKNIIFSSGGKKQEPQINETQSAAGRAGLHLCIGDRGGPALRRTVPAAIPLLSAAALDERSEWVGLCERRVPALLPVQPLCNAVGTDALG